MAACTPANPTPTGGVPGRAPVWVTTEQVATAAGQDPAAPPDVAWLQTVTDATNAYIARKRPDLPETGYTETDGRYADVCAGAQLLAVTMYQRRGGGAEFDMYTYPARMVDANIRALLGLDLPVIA